MNLKELKDEIKNLKKQQSDCDHRTVSGESRFGFLQLQLDAMKQVVEAVDEEIFQHVIPHILDRNLWQEIKGLLGSKP